MAEAAVLAPVGWLLGPAITMAFNKACEHLGTGIEERREILEATLLPTLSLAIEKVDKSPNKEKLVDWLRRLKDAYYEAEEAIDLLEYGKLKQKVKDDRKTLKQKAKNERGTPLSLPLQFVPRPKIASVKLKHGLSVFSRQKKMLKHCIDNLIDIREEAKGFRDLLEVQENAKSGDAHRDTSETPPMNVFGREKEKKYIVGLLTKKLLNSQPVIPIIAITGRSGVGKTTLAQDVYKQMDRPEHFDLRLWVHVPRKFEATHVIKSMIENIEAKEHTPNSNPSKNLQPLSSQIGRMLGSKKLLLVLDDFWSDTKDFVEQWDKFIRCSSSCLPGSTILLTTQSKSTPQQAVFPGVEVETYNIEEIEEGPFLHLFMHYAWPSNSHLQIEEFEKIGQKIAVKLKGDPGAAKLVGHQLSGKLDPGHWNETAAKDWLGDDMKARFWSYQQLPPDLQRCFASCSLFPKGLTFPRRYLIDFSMALGLIRPNDEHQRLEDIGQNYLDELVSRFFLEQDEDKNGIHLHDLLHDLAERVQGDDFIRIESTYAREVPSPLNIRHIYLPSSMINELQEKLSLMKNIRTFCVEPDGAFVPKKVLEDILKHMEKLRVLELPECGDKLPDSIGNLKHLRLLHSYGSRSLKKLPDFICKLYHLRKLVLPNCESLPKNFSDLISLRCSLTDGETTSHISHVGRLTSLQELDQFVVKKEYGNKLHQLENLNQLRGEICIASLENVGSTTDAVKANMRNKEHIKELKLEWKSDERDTHNITGPSKHVEILDALQPHPDIGGLTIKGFGGERFPNWLLSQNSLKHLRSLILMDCNNVEEISSIHESLPSCTRLILLGFKNLKKMPTFPPNLTSLEINNIPQVSYFSEDDFLKKEERNQSKHKVVKQIVDWLKAEDVRLSIDFEKNVKLFSIFVKNRLDDTPDLILGEWAEILTFDPWNKDYSEEQLLDAWVKFMHCHMETMFYKNEESKLVLPSSLTYLKISSCSITDDALSTCLQCLVSLSKLKLSNIQTITSLPPKEVLCSLKHFLSLTIEGCYLLSSLGGIGGLTSLIELKLYDCPNLNISDDSLPSFLEMLKFYYCSKAAVIHALNVSDVIRALDVGNLSLLKELDLMGWDGHLKGLNSLTSLHRLSVVQCPAINLSSPTDKYAFPLQEVVVDDLKLLKLKLSDETISRIDSLSIFGFQGDFSDDEVFQSLTSVKTLFFYNFKTTHLPKSLKDLASVNRMILVDCPTLTYPGILEDLPRNILELEIEGCPTLTEKLKEGGPNFQVRFSEGDTIVTFPREEGKNRF